MGSEGLNVDVSAERTQSRDPLAGLLALQHPAKIGAAHLRQAQPLLSEHSRASGVRPVFATHDRRLHAAIAARACSAAWDYEFEMLLDARDDLARADPVAAPAALNPHTAARRAQPRRSRRHYRNLRLTAPRTRAGTRAAPARCA